MNDRLIRFKDLKERGIVPNHQTMSTWVKKNKFPPGRWLGNNSHVWTESEIQAWLETRPTKRPCVSNFDHWRSEQRRRADQAA
jgi:predicted DNA-binding transcriptional regulator AlpA